MSKIYWTTQFIASSTVTGVSVKFETWQTLTSLWKRVQSVFRTYPKMHSLIGNSESFIVWLHVGLLEGLLHLVTSDAEVLWVSW